MIEPHPRPAGETRQMTHLDVLAAAEESGIGLQMHRITGPSETSEQAAATLGCRVEQIVKSVLFMTGIGPVLVLQSGPRRTDQKQLARILGVARSSIRLTTPAETIAISGAPVGHVPPAGHPTKLRTFIDESCFVHEAVYFAAAEKGVLLSSTPEELARFTSAERAALAQ